MILQISYALKSGRWGHRPRRVAAVCVPTNGYNGVCHFHL
jgi:hypothetical protein